MRGRQRFNAITHKDSGQLYDVMALGLSSPEAAALSRFEMQDLATVTTVDPGDEVMATGFPGLADAPIAPSTLQARVDRIDGASVQLTEPGVPGYSGSALMCSRGLVGILHGDVGAESNLTNALALSFEVLRSELFR